MITCDVVIEETKTIPTKTVPAKSTSTKFNKKKMTFKTKNSNILLRFC